MKITFLFCFADGLNAMLEYKEQPDRVLNMHHTYTPAKYRGQGLAKQMAEVGFFSFRFLWNSRQKITQILIFQQFAFTYAIENNYRVRPTCTYLADFVRKTDNQSFKNVVVDAKL